MDDNSRNKEKVAKDAKNSKNSKNSYRKRDYSSNKERITEKNRKLTKKIKLKMKIQQLGSRNFALLIKKAKLLRIAERAKGHFLLMNIFRKKFRRDILAENEQWLLTLTAFSEQPDYREEQVMEKLKEAFLGQGGFDGIRALAIAGKDFEDDLFEEREKYLSTLEKAMEREGGDRNVLVENTVQLLYIKQNFNIKTISKELRNIEEKNDLKKLKNLFNVKKEAMLSEYFKREAVARLAPYKNKKDWLKLAKKKFVKNENFDIHILSKLKEAKLKLTKKIAETLKRRETKKTRESSTTGRANPPAE